MSEKESAPTVKVEIKPPFEKKPRSEAQKEAAKKGLMALRAKREKVAKAEQEKLDSEVKDLETQKSLRAKARRKGLADELPTKDEVVALRKELEEAKKAKAEVKIVEKEVIKEVPKEVVKEVIKEVPKEVVKYVEKPAPVPPPQQKLTGHALLDRVFGFEK